MQNEPPTIRVPSTVAMPRATCEILAVYLLHALSVNDIRADKPGRLARMLGFSSAESLMFHAGMKYCQDEGYLQITSSQDKFRVTQQGFDFVNNFANLAGPEFGWSNLYDEKGIREYVLAQERDCGCGNSFYPGAG